MYKAINNTLFQLIPPHIHYIEIYGNSNGLIFTKKPSVVETFNDVDSVIVNFFRVLRDNELSQKLIQFVNNLPEPLHPISSINEKQKPYLLNTTIDLKKAIEFIATIYTNVNKIYLRKNTESEKYNKESYNLLPPLIKTIILRVIFAQIEHCDILECLDRHNDNSFLLYINMDAIEKNMPEQYITEILVEVKETSSKTLVLCDTNSKTNEQMKGWNKVEMKKEKKNIWFNYQKPNVNKNTFLEKAEIINES